MVRAAPSGSCRCAQTGELSTELDGAGRQLRSLGETLSLRRTHRWEMRHLLELCCFEVVAELGDFKGGPPADGREQVWVVRART